MPVRCARHVWGGEQHAETGGALVGASLREATFARWYEWYKPITTACAVRVAPSSSLCRSHDSVITAVCEQQSEPHRAAAAHAHGVARQHQAQQAIIIPISA